MPEPQFFNGPDQRGAYQAVIQRNDAFSATDAHQAAARFARQKPTPPLTSIALKCPLASYGYKLCKLHE
jgi:hypothetical protein